MPDLLNALRRLYGELGTEGIPPDGDEAEVWALAEVKAGLDALPPQRPDTGTLEAVLDAAREAPLAPIRAVYGEGEALDTPEAAALAEMKAGLDALPPQRPDAATLEAVLAAASGQPITPAADRPARRLVTRRRAAVLGAAFAFLLVLASGLWLGQGEEALPIAANERQAETAPGASSPEVPSPEAETPEAFEVLDDAASGETVAGALADAAPSREPATDEPVPAAPDALQDAVALPALIAAPSGLADEAEELVPLDELPLADGDDELRLLYLRMREMQDAQAGLGWDESPTALGAEPDSVPTATGWMQVRVER